VSQSVFQILESLYQQKSSTVSPSDIIMALAQNRLITEAEFDALKKISQQNKQSVFISYRRKDTLWFTRQLQELVREEFPNIEIFWDLELAIGDDFVQAIEDAVSQCQVLLAIIGDDWLTIEDENGKRRLDNPNDFVRLEIVQALKHSIHVIPILVDNTPMPSADLLPDDLKHLVRRQALEVDAKRFRHDVNVLLNELHKIFL
jgi:TIR domain-containing protein